ncbi:MAG TPA: dTDP-4-dehydrorhamnose 3,5-epimerase [Alphaproteobacteria bacterium]|nr:dTDP-4-dehydrorhamnose 3,5-epimerase [Alphaproteobacteria bacterium]
MKFVPTPFAGAFIIEPERLEDERGFFARCWCRTELETHGLVASFAQCNISFNRKLGTLRGLHYQAAPYCEAKIVRCTRGRAFDVMVDLRPSSPTRHHWHAVELSADNARMVYVPEHFAHGFQTLEDDTELFYQMSEDHRPEAACGLRFDDPAFAIAWPIDNPILSLRDLSFPLLGVEQIAC